MRPRPTMPSVLLGQLRAHVLLAVPASFDQALVGGRDVARQGQHQGDGVLGRADRVAGRRVHHDDALAAWRLLAIDVVDAHAGPHDRLQTPVAFQRLGRDLHAAAADRAVELGQRLAQFLALQARADFVFDALGGIQQSESFLEILSRTMIFAIFVPFVVAYSGAAGLGLRLAATQRGGRGAAWTQRPHTLPVGSWLNELNSIAQV